MKLEIRNNRIVRKIYTGEDTFDYMTLLEVNGSVVSGDLSLFMNRLLKSLNS